jgi:transposase-like protein
MMNGRKRVKFQQRYEKRHGSLSKDLFAKIVGPTAAERFLAKALGGKNHLAPRVINTDEHAGYPPAIMRLKADGALEEDCRHRPVQYLNNVLEQDHRAIKRRIRASQYFRSFWGACRTIAGYEAIHMIRKGQASGSAPAARAGLLHRYILGLFSAAVV